MTARNLEFLRLHGYWEMASTFQSFVREQVVYGVNVQVDNRLISPVWHQLLEVRDPVRQMLGLHNWNLFGVE